MVPLLSRRQVLLGGAASAGAVLLGACGGDGGSDAQGSTTTTASGAGDLVLAQFFGGAMFVAGEPARMPFGVADADGLLDTESTPAELDVQILAPDGSEVGDPIAVSRHAEGLPRAYFPLVATLEEPGYYMARVELDGVGTEMSFQVDRVDDVKVLRPGQPLPALDTPTVADPRGVNPICTNDPVCPLHDVTLAEALAEGAPVALLVATPAFCQIAICGPVLDVLLDVVAEHPQVRFLHAEVYADPAVSTAAYAPVVGSLGLHFEPALFLAGSDGVVADRVDTIYDRAELEERLARLT